MKTGVRWLMEQKNNGEKSIDYNTEAKELKREGR